mgnify:CR=1 FL=1
MVSGSTSSFLTILTNTEIRAQSIDGKEKYSIKLYKFIDFFIQNNFSNEILEIINKSKSNKKINIFDIGSYLVNFSREIKNNFSGSC